MIVVIVFFFYLGYNGLKNVNDHYLFRLLLAQLNNCFFLPVKRLFMLVDRAVYICKQDKKNLSP